MPRTNNSITALLLVPLRSGRAVRARWLERFDRELDMRAVLDRLEREGDGYRASVVAGAMWRYWYMRSHFREGRRRLERVLALDRGQSIARGKVLHGAAVMAMNSGDLASAERSAHLNKRAAGSPPAHQSLLTEG